MAELKTGDRLESLAALDRGELLLDTDLSYDGITPVRVRVTKREGRYKFSDDGGAIAAAGRLRAPWVLVGRIQIGSQTVNVTRQGVVWLPAFERSPEEWFANVTELVAAGSLALYELLLELQG